MGMSFPMLPSVRGGNSSPVQCPGYEEEGKGLHVKVCHRQSKTQV